MVVVVVVAVARQSWASPLQMSLSGELGELGESGPLLLLQTIVRVRGSGCIAAPAIITARDIVGSFNHSGEEVGGIIVGHMTAIVRLKNL